MGYCTLVSCSFSWVKPSSWQRIGQNDFPDSNSTNGTQFTKELIDFGHDLRESIVNELAEIFEPMYKLLTPERKKQNGLQVQYSSVKDFHVVTIGVAGIPKSELKVSADGDILNIHAKYKSCVMHDNDKICFDRSFDHSVKIPFDSDPSGIFAEMDNGILIVKIPRAKKSIHKEIQIM